MTIRFKDYTVTFAAVRNEFSDGLIDDTRQFLCRLCLYLSDAMRDNEVVRGLALEDARQASIDIYRALDEVGFYDDI